MDPYDFIFLDVDDGAGGGGDGNPPADDGAGADDKGGDAKPLGMTQEEFNRIDKKTKEKATNKVLKDLGFDSLESGKERLKILKDLEDGNKTELQKITDQNKTVSDELKTANTRADKADLKVEAMLQGVNHDLVENAISIAATFEGETPADKVKAMLEKMPEFKGKANPQGPANLGGPLGGEGKGNKDTTRDAVKRGMGLKS